MSQLEAQGENAEQIEYWNGQAGENWTDRNDEMDTMLRPLGATAIDRAEVVSGEHILDIGCGYGGTSLDLVSCVGSSGHVLGADISEPMLALATAGFGNINFEATSPIMKMGRGQSLEETAEFFMKLGPVSRALVDQADSLRIAVKAAIVTAIEDRYRDGFVEMGGRCWVVAADNGGISGDSR